MKRSPALLPPVIISFVMAAFGSACASIEPIDGAVPREDETGGSPAAIGGSGLGEGEGAGGSSNSGGQTAVGGSSISSGAGGNSPDCPAVMPAMSSACTPIPTGSGGGPATALTCIYGTERCLCRPLTSMWWCVQIMGAGGSS